jgi:divalent metal cation (Fe/Co/Zn/Cd) transporter
MNQHKYPPLAHDHHFDAGNQSAEAGTKVVMWISAAMMVIEIVFGWLFNSMSLLADGWHMSSHTLAIGLSAFAYAAARKYAFDERFAFGTWKIEVLGGYTSAIFLLAIALLMFFGSFERIYQPLIIQYEQAIGVAILGLVVNLVCAYILFKSGHNNHHHHHHNAHKKRDEVSAHEAHEHAPDVQGPTPHSPLTHVSQSLGHDLNLRAAYLHVVSDAATSVLAIVALVLGWLYGLDWLDPLVGILGAVLIALWSKNLLTETSKVLLDCEMDHPVVFEIKQLMFDFPAKTRLEIADLHVWRVGKKNYSCALVLVSQDPHVVPGAIKKELEKIKSISHTTIEINYVHWA